MLFTTQVATNTSNYEWINQSLNQVILERLTLRRKLPWQTLAIQHFWCRVLSTCNRPSIAKSSKKNFKSWSSFSRLEILKLKLIKKRCKNIECLVLVCCMYANTLIMNTIYFTQVGRGTILWMTFWHSPHQIAILAMVLPSLPSLPPSIGII